MSKTDNAVDRRILVVRGGAIGDFILTLPVLAALRRRFPQHRLEVLGYPSVAALAVAGGLVDDVRALESAQFAGFFVANGSWSEEVGAWFSGFESIISYLHDPHGMFQANVARCSGANFIVGPHRPDETLEIHAVEQLLRPLQAVGIRNSNQRPRLPFPPVDSGTMRVALHPGSGSEKKNWPEAQWAGLLKLIADQTDCDIMLIGGEAEGERCARLAERFPKGRVKVAQNLPLLELAFRMQDCVAFVGHDSGMTHLAAALDLPGLVLWGESSLATWRPQSARLKILRDPGGLAALPVAAVWDAFKHFEWQFPVLNPKLVPNHRLNQEQ